nr:hypothetical protein Iba_chr09bCG0030 [Ipomoea batatas]
MQKARRQPLWAACFSLVPPPSAMASSDGSFHQVCQVPSAALAVCLRIATSVVATFLSYQLQKAASANEMSSPESAAKSASCLEPKDSNNHKLSLFCSKLGSHSGLV